MYGAHTNQRQGPLVRLTTPNRLVRCGERLSEMLTSAHSLGNDKPVNFRTLQAKQLLQYLERVLAEEGGSRDGPDRRVRELQGRTDERNLACGGVIHLSDHVPLQHFLGPEGLGNRPDFSRRQSAGSHPRDPMPAGLLGEFGFQEADERLPIDYPIFVHLEAGIACPVWLVQYVNAEAAELRITADGNDDSAVAGREGLVRSDIGMRVSIPLRSLA